MEGKERVEEGSCTEGKELAGWSPEGIERPEEKGRRGRRERRRREGRVDVVGQKERREGRRVESRTKSPFDRKLVVTREILLFFVSSSAQSGDPIAQPV